MPPTARLAGALLLGAALAVLAAVPASAVTPNGRLQIIHLDVGQGDGTVIITPQGQVVLIDGGQSYATTPAQLAALGVTHVDLYFASHYHSDHIGCISQIVNSGVTIDAGWDRGESYTTGAYTTYVNTLGPKRHTLVKGQVFTLDSLSAHPVIIKCVDLNGAGIATSDENAKSVVLKVSYGEYDETFGGDLQGSGSSNIEAVVGPEVGPVECYKVHHHGSRYSTSDVWLNATTPKVAVVQEGNGNSYGHPTAEAMGRLHAHGVRVYWNELGAGATPDPNWDRVANGQVIIQATWQPAGVDTVRGPTFNETFTNSGTADLTSPTVTVLAPNGGEAWEPGSAHDITWSASDNIGLDSVNVDYSLHGAAGPWEPVQHGLANSGLVSWALPVQASDSVLVRVAAYDHVLNQGQDLSDGLFRINPGPVGVPVGGAPLFALSPPVPNPSRGSAGLEFSLASGGTARIEVLDVSGRRVRSWEQAGLDAGAHRIAWDGRSAAGVVLGQGLYFVRLTGPSGTRTVKLLRMP
ncbi:MAG: T9SS type A sorting domain-containing protein [Candidatus Eisenbacteria bacterium]|nr:T9SS type A sorting domain-containing protein [Candidatus Eisenbacteria bacterium]